jgi:hypothetical protein
MKYGGVCYLFILKKKKINWNLSIFSRIRTFLCKYKIGSKRAMHPQPAEHSAPRHQQGALPAGTRPYHRPVLRSSTFKCSSTYIAPFCCKLDYLPALRRWNGASIYQGESAIFVYTNSVCCCIFWLLMSPLAQYFALSCVIEVLPDAKSVAGH